MAGDSSYSIAWLALGNRTGSDNQFGRAFLYLNGLPSTDNTTRVLAPQFNPFNVWKEQARDGNHLNFLTGAGGFLQNVMQGYGGLRARRPDSVSGSGHIMWRPQLPPHINKVRFARLSFLGVVYSVEYDEQNISVSLDEHNGRQCEVCTPALACTGGTECCAAGTGIAECCVALPQDGAPVTKSRLAGGQSLGFSISCVLSGEVQ